MGIARNIARLIPNGSGLLPNANIEAVAASKLTGQVADANAPSGSVIQVQSITMRGIFGTTSVGSFVLVSDGTDSLQLSITKLNSSSTLMIMSNINAYAFNSQGGGFVVVRGSSYNSANVVQAPTSSGSRQQTNIGTAWTGDGSGDTTMMLNISTIITDNPGAGTFTYGIYCTTNSSSQSGTTVNRTANDDNNNDIPRSVSTLTIMEIAA